MFLRAGPWTTRGVQRNQQPAFGVHDERNEPVLVAHTKPFSAFRRPEFHQPVRWAPFLSPVTKPPIVNLFCDRTPKERRLRIPRATSMRHAR
jgi:hypothetical protein